MASTSGGRKKRLVSSLDGEVLERLSMKLNPRMLMKDYQSLAGRLKYTYEYIRNFARERNPTLALLQHWWSSKRGKEKTVSVLIEHLSDMERDDAVDLLTPYEFYYSHEASEYDENVDQPVIAGAIDLNTNPYNPHFPAREHYQQQSNEFGAANKVHQNNGHQNFPDRRVTEQHQQNNAGHQGMNSAQQLGYRNNVYDDQFNQKMLNLRLQDYANNRPENRPGMMSSASFPAAASDSPSVTSSMDSLQFEKHLESVAPTPLPTPWLVQSPLFEKHRPHPFDGSSVSSAETYSMTADGYHGARRDIRLHGRPHPLDGSSVSSGEVGIQREFMGLPRRDMMMGGNRDMREYEHYTRTGVDTRFWRGGYGECQSTAAAETHSMTVAADKVALVIGNKDYEHPKLRGLLYPEQDAADVAAVLKRLNFKVISLVNLTLSEMRTAMLAFCCLLGRGVYGVVYYAGHGYEDNGENYLLPVDSDLKYNREHSLRTQEILEAMQQCDTSLNLLIIDACRVSLPNKSGTKVPRVKRNTVGNNIFAYSCCSQQESLEQPRCRNGMYCTHLLRKLGEDRRVEHVLMDVATEFARTYNLPQRPCLETDTKADFRLTDPIEPDIQPGNEYVERCRRWMEAQRHPQQFSVGPESVRISLEFFARFSNILGVSIVAEKKTSIKEFHLSLETADPLCCKTVQVTPFTEVNNDSVVYMQQFEIQNIQKHLKLQTPVMITIRAMYRDEGELCKYEKEIDLGWPLVSSITSLWDRWLLGDRCKMTAV